MAEFIHGGPKRFEHQKRGLQKLLSSGGVAALLFDPGTGKTATMIDYLSILALKLPPKEIRQADGSTALVQEARALVVAPLAAVDTWVLQMGLFASPQVNWWAEVVGDSIFDRAEALASRGGNPMPLCNAPYETATKRQRRCTRPILHLGDHAQRRRRVEHPRALHQHYSWAWGAYAPDRLEEGRPPITPSEGPDGLGTKRPRIVLEVSNIDTFSTRQTTYGPRGGTHSMSDIVLDGVRRFAPDIVIVDESHKIKSATGHASRLMDRIGQIVPRRSILTGTVMPAGPMDVFGQWRFLDPYAFGMVDPDGSRNRATMGSFQERFAVLGGYMGQQVTGYKNIDQMQATMAERAVVARKRDVLPDLPAVTEITVPVHLSKAELDAYASMKKDLVNQFLSGAMTSAANRLTQMMRLRQITSGHLPDDFGAMHVLGDSKVATMHSVIQDQLVGEERVVAFCFFTHEIDALCERLSKDSKTEVMKITGETDNDERIRMRLRFGDKSIHKRMVIVAQVKTLSLAVNELVSASHAVFGSLSQQRDDWIQAKDRLDRMGQTLPVTFWHCIAPHTVDEAILQSHRSKTDLETSVLKHILEDTFEDGKTVDE